MAFDMTSTSDSGVEPNRAGKTPVESIRSWDQEYLLHEELLDFEEFSDIPVKISSINGVNTCIKGYLYCLKLLTHELNQGAIMQNLCQLKQLSHDIKAVIQAIKDLAIESSANQEYYQKSQDILQKLSLLSSWDQIVVSLVSQFFSSTEKFVRNHEQVQHLPFLVKLHDQFIRIKERKTSADRASSTTDVTFSSTTTSSSNYSSEEENGNLSSSISSSLGLSSADTECPPVISYEKELSVCAPVVEESVEPETAPVEDSISEADNNSSDIESVPCTTEKVVGEPKGSTSRTSPVALHKTRRRAFSLASDVRLIHGVEVFGVGCWTAILKNYDFPSYRTACHLKDRWRTLAKLQIVEEDDKGYVLEEPHKTALEQFKEAEKLKRDKSIPTIFLPRRTKPNKQAPSEKTPSATADEDFTKKPDTLGESSSSPTTQSETETQPEETTERTEIPEPGDDPNHNRKKSPRSKPKEPARPEDDDFTTDDDHSLTADEAPKEDHSVIRDATVDSTGSDRNINISQVVSLAGSSDEAAGKQSRSSDERESPQKHGDAAASVGHSKATPPKRRRLWDVEGEVMTWDDPVLEPTILPRRKAAKAFDTIEEVPKRTHKKVAWAKWEVDNLMKGIDRYGHGQWAMILDRFKFNNRTAVMLKDKHRTIMKNKEN